MLADWYGWSLREIFEYVTIADVAELSKYARPRLDRRRDDAYLNYGYILRAAGYYEKGSDKQFNSLMDGYKPRDESYLNKKLDKQGLANLAKTVAANRAKMAENRKNAT